MCLKTIRLCGVALALALVAAQTAVAATLTVTSPADSGAGTLRAALSSAANGDTIDFQLPALPATITLNSTLTVGTSVTITGPGQSQLTLDGQSSSLVFYVAPGTTVEMSDLTIANGGNDFAGGIFNDQASLTLDRCTLSGNTGYLAGAILNDASGYFTSPIGSTAALTMTDCTVSGNSSSDVGAGGIMNEGLAGSATLDMSNCAITGSTGYLGGGVTNDSDFLYTVFGGLGSPLGGSAATTLTDCAVSGNTGVNGAGACNLSFAGDASLTVSHSLISANTAGSGGGVLNIWEGPIESLTSGGAELAIANSTMSDNAAISGGSGEGGAIVNYLGSSTVDNATLSGNSADGDGGGIYNLTDPSLGDYFKIKNTILNAGTQGANLYNTGAGTIESYGYNLSSDDGGGFLTATGDQISTDPMLGPLQDNGGPTYTQALLPGSPAIDKGDSTDIAGNTVTTDQRGVTRPQGAGWDIGAFELQYEYTWTNVLPPVDPAGSSVFKAGSTVPVKFMLTGIYASITNLQATLSYAQVVNNVVGTTYPAASKVPANRGGLFRYDPTNNQYIFNWSTKGLSPGNYRLFIDLGDGVIQTVDVTLK